MKLIQTVKVKPSATLSKLFQDTSTNILMQVKGFLLFSSANHWYTRGDSNVNAMRVRRELERGKTGPKIEFLIYYTLG